MTYLVAFALSGGFLLVEAWAFMILVGVLHGEWLPMLPTIDYASALLVGLALTLLTSTIAAAVGVAKGLIDE